MLTQESGRMVYLTVEDVRALECMLNQVLMVFRAPAGTKLDLSEDVNEDGEKRYRIEMQSTGGPIGVWIINEPSPAPGDLENALAAPDDLTLDIDPYLDPTSMFLSEEFAGLSDYYPDGFDGFDEK